MNDNAYENMALMLGDWALTYGKSKQDAYNYMDKILVLDELTRAKMVQSIDENIDKVRSNSNE
jgi:hypothetical protein